MSDIDTIFALSSGAGRAGVAVIRVSGPRALSCARAIAESVSAPRRALLRALRDPATGEIIDRGLVLAFPGPASFTGEDLVEFHVHGGRAIIRRLLGVMAGLPGCRPAKPGEFTRQALLNGKLDLPAVEGLADLIAADTEEQRRQALRQAEGVLGEQTRRWRANLIEAMGLVEAMIDFADEDDVAAEANIRRFRQIVLAVKADMDSALAAGQGAERLRDGFRVVIAGPPNAGKSTLLNALAKRDVAIVSAEAGTTRDAIEIALDLDGLPVIVIDTAGIRQAAGAIESQGVARALERAQSADLVLWLDAVDSPRSEPPEAPAPLLRVVSKIDSCPEHIGGGGDMAISALTGAGMRELLNKMRAEAAKLFSDGQSLTVRDRHRQCLLAASLAMGHTLETDELELAAEGLRQAMRDLAELLGLVGVEDVLDAVFSRFCIGK